MSDNEPTLEPFVSEMGAGKKTVSLNLLVRQLATAAQTGGEFGLIEFSGVKGTGAPPHTHGAEAEAFFVTEGTIRISVGDIEHLANVGDFVYIPKNTRHKFKIESEFGRTLLLITPGTGFEEFFVEMGTEAGGPMPPNPDHFAPFTPRADAQEVAKRFHLGFVEDW